MEERVVRGREGEAGVEERDGEEEEDGGADGAGVRAVAGTATARPQEGFIRHFTTTEKA